MTQIFFPPISSIEQQKVYCYVNNFAKVVVAKVNGLKNRHCERVIFPTEKFLFMADDNCELEIHQQTDQGITRDIIACSELEVASDLSSR